MKRRSFLKGMEGAAAGTVMGGVSPTVANTGQGEGSTPIKNVLFLFVDQQRQDCIGSYGNNIVKTPNLDRLANSGVRFTNCYTPAPVCTPARMSAQCGLWAHNHKMLFNTGNARHKGGQDDPDSGVRFFSEDLKDKGWNLSHVGKWHVGTEKTKPSTRGYDDLPFYPGYGVPNYIYGYKRNPRLHPHYEEYLKQLGLDGFNITDMKNPDGTLFSGLQEGPKEASIPYYLANQTIDEIKKHSQDDSPFFISCHFWGPHAPYCVPEPYHTMYNAADIEPWLDFDCDLSDKPQVLRRYGDYLGTDWFNRKNISRLIGEYYGYITLIDDEIGRILDTLEAEGKLEETLIVYSADHGSSVGSYRLWDKGYGMYDNFTRVPLIASHPSFKPAVNDSYVTLLDLPATFLEAGGLGSGHMDGSSLMPLLTGRKERLREDHIVTEHHGHHCPFWQRMVRTDSGKFIFNYTATHEFYDLENDPHETKNLIDTVSSQTLKPYEDMLINWMDETKDPFSGWAKNGLMDDVHPY